MFQGRVFQGRVFQDYKIQSGSRRQKPDPLYQNNQYLKTFEAITKNAQLIFYSSFEFTSTPEHLLCLASIGRNAKHKSN